MIVLYEIANIALQLTDGRLVVVDFLFGQLSNVGYRYMPEPIVQVGLGSASEYLMIGQEPILYKIAKQRNVSVCLHYKAQRPPFTDNWRICFITAQHPWPNRVEIRINQTVSCLDPVQHVAAANKSDVWAYHRRNQLRLS